MANLTDVGKRHRAARKYAGYNTAADAAEALGVKYPTYVSHENGHRGVVRACDIYSRRYKVSLDWLLQGIGKGPGDFNTYLECKFDEFLKLYEAADDKTKAQVLRASIAALSDESVYHPDSWNKTRQNSR